MAATTPKISSNHQLSELFQHHSVFSTIPTPRSRDFEQLDAALRGKLESLTPSLRSLTPESQKRIIRFFVSSTFTDTFHERAVLLQYVLPFVRVILDTRARMHSFCHTHDQDVARAVNFEIFMSEMRFGIRHNHDHKTSEICMAELSRCQKYSAGLNYLLISTNKYGYRPSPRVIPEDEMQNLITFMSQASRDLVLEYYALDTNSVDPVTFQASPVYLLRPTNEIHDFWGRINEVTKILRDCALQLWPNSFSEMNAPSSRHRIKYYFFSITEEEIHNGMYWVPEHLQAANVRVCRRILIHPDKSPISHDSPKALPAWPTSEIFNYVDADSDSQSLLQQQQDSIKRCFNNSLDICYKEFSPVPLLSQQSFQKFEFNPCHPEHADYLNQFAIHTTNCLLDSLVFANENLAVENHPLMDEICYHWKYALDCLESYCSYSDVDDTQTHIRRYMESSSTSSIFVLHGTSGCGKTFALAKAATDSSKISCDQDCVIVRFLGTSFAASNLPTLLASICSQLYSISGKESPPLHDLNKLIDYFISTLCSWDSGRLILFLDGLDLLSASCFWLPVSNLSPFVKVIVSCIKSFPSDNSCLAHLQSRLNAPHMNDSFVELNPTRADATSILRNYLKIQHRPRNLSFQQLQVLDNCIKILPHEAAPLVANLLAMRFRDLPSFTVLPIDNLNCDKSLFIQTNSVFGLIGQFFESLMQKHGKPIVLSCLSYISIVQEGISETELLEALSCDDDVLADCYEWWVPSVRTLPFTSLCLLLEDIRPYLSERASSDGAHIFCWRQRQFKEAWISFYLYDCSTLRRMHSQLGEYFSGRWSNCLKPLNSALSAQVQKVYPLEIESNRFCRDQSLTFGKYRTVFGIKCDGQNINFRRIVETAHHFIEAGLYSEAAKELCSFETIYAFLLLGLSHRMLHHFSKLYECMVHELQHLNVSFLPWLRRVEHYKRWLLHDISLISANPQSILSSSSMQPISSLVRQDCLWYIRNNSSCDFTKISWVGSFVLGGSDDQFGSLMSVIHGHTHFVLCAAYNSDGTKIATASADLTIRIWNVKDQSQISCFNHSSSICALSWSPCNLYLCASSCNRASLDEDENCVHVWNVLSMNKVLQLSGHQGGISSLSWSPDGFHIASGSLDSTLRLWDVASKNSIIFNDFDSEINSISWNKASSILAIATGNIFGAGNIQLRILEVEKSRMFTLSSHSDAFSCVAWSTFGSELAFGAVDGTVFLWPDINASKSFVLKGHSSSVLSLVWLHSDHFVASSSHDSSIRIWDTKSYSLFAVLKGHVGPVNCLSSNPRIMQIASAGSDRSLRIWEGSLFRNESTMHSHQSGVKCLALSPDCSRLVSGGGDTDLRIWDTVSCNHVGALTGHTAAICFVSWSPDGLLIASASFDNSVRIWDCSTLEVKGVINGHSDVVTAVVWSPNGRYITTCSSDKSIRLWDALTHKKSGILKAHDLRVNSVAWSRCCKHLSSCSDDRMVCVHDAKSGKTTHRLSGHSDSVTKVAWSPSGTFLASSSLDKTVRIWSASTFRTVSTLMGHTAGVTSLAWSSNNSMLATGSLDRTVCIWEARKSQLLAKFEGHSSSVNSIVWGRNDITIFSASNDNTIRMWSVHENKNSTLPVISEQVVASYWSAKNSFLATVMSGVGILLWSLSSGSAFCQLNVDSATVLSFSWSDDCCHVAYSCSDGFVRVWNVALFKEVHRSSRMPPLGNLCWKGGVLSDINHPSNIIWDPTS